MEPPLPLQEGAPRLRVSILVKALNEAENIDRCVRSCLQALEQIGGEVIVADSLSDDETVALATRYPVTVVQLLHRRDRGCGVGAQLAFQHARGEFLHVIDGDMELPLDFLPKALELMDREPRVAGVGGQLEEIRPDTDLARIRANRRRRAHSGVGPVEVLNGGGLYRREAIEDAGGYLTHPALHSHEEFELALRLKARGWSLIRIAEVSMRHSGHADAAFRLLRKRWQSGYAFGSGELLRLTFGQPYFHMVVRKFPLHFLTWLSWFIAASSLALTFTSPWFAAGAILALFVPVMAMVAVKRNVGLGLYAVAGWHVFAAGAIAGIAKLRPGSPTRAIGCRVVSKPQDALPHATHDGKVASVDATNSKGTPPNRNTGGSERGLDAGGVANPYAAGNVRRGLIQFVSGRFYMGVVQFALVALYVRYMQIADYAAYTTYSNLGAIAAGLTLVGLDRAAMRYYPEARLSGSIGALKHLVRTLTLVRFSILLVAVIGLLMFSDSVLRLLQLDGYRSTLWVAVMLMAALAITRYQSIALQSLMLQRQLTVGLVMGITTRLVVVLVTIWHSGRITVIWGLGAMAIGEWLLAGVQWRAYRSHIEQLASSLDSNLGTWRPDYRAIRRYAFVNGYSSILRLSSSKSALLLIGATYLPAPVLAAFGFFQALGERVRPYLPIFLTRTLIEPVAMAYYLKERNFANFSRVMSVSLKLNLLVIAPLVAWLAFAGNPALGVLTGGKFMDHAWVLLIIVIALISTSHWALLELTANAVGHSTLLAQGSTIAAASTVVFLVVTQPWAGVLGLALTGLVSTLIGNIFGIWALRRAGYDYRLEYTGAYRIVVNAVAAGLLAYAVAWLAGPYHTLAGSLAGLVACVLVFVTFGLVNRPFDPAEREILIRLLPRKLHRRFKPKQ